MLLQDCCFLLTFLYFVAYVERLKVDAMVGEEMYLI